MTTAKSSSGNPGTARGRGLDALFEGATAPAPASRSVDADLAALLDNEVNAAETGAAAEAERVLAPTTRSVLQDTSAGWTSPARGLDVPSGTDYVDVPPSAAEAQTVEPAPAEPVQTGPVQPAAPSTPAASGSSQAEQPLPTTKRFGAIIMDTAPQESPQPAQPSTEALVPTLPATKSVMPPVDLQPETPTSLPTPIELTEEQKAIVISRLAKIIDSRKLNQEIDDLYKQVVSQFSSPPEKAELALTMLREARDILVNTPEQVVSAEYRTMQVQAMLERVQESRKHAGFYGPRILFYQAGWLLVFLAGLIFAGPVTNWITAIGNVSGPALMNIYPIFNTMIWGGIGGIVGALYSLWWHISEQQDFDRNYLMWYLVQPMLGLVLGGIVFLLLAGGFLILQVNLNDANAATGARLLPYLVAVLGGFRQNFIYQQFDRLISLFTTASSNQGQGNGAGTAGGQ